MPPVGFEPTISVLEWAKTVHALDRASPYEAEFRKDLAPTFQDKLAYCEEQLQSA
jgi:hypothetical protein